MLNKKIAGFTIIEILVALAVASIIGAAVISLVLQVQATTTTAEVENQANDQAEQAVEQVVAFRNNCGWDAFPPTPVAFKTINGVKTVCQAVANGNACPATTTVTPGTFDQCISLSDVPSNVSVKQAIVFVYYSDRGKNKTVSLSRYISKI